MDFGCNRPRNLRETYETIDDIKKEPDHHKATNRDQFRRHRSVVPEKTAFKVNRNAEACLYILKLTYEQNKKCKCGLYCGSLRLFGAIKGGGGVC